MVDALALRRSRGWWRCLLAFVLAGLWPLTIAAQTGGKPPSDASKKGSAPDAKKDTGKAAPKDAAKGAPKTTAPAPPATPEEEEQAGIIDAAKAMRRTRVEILRDPRAEKVLEVDQFKEIQAAPGRAAREKEITEMATGAETLDRDRIQKWVSEQVAALTNHNNLRAWLNAEPATTTAAQATTNTRLRALDQASESLVNTLNLANNSNNTQFKREYVRVLLTTLPKALDNHLLARTEAMMVLAKTGDPEAIPICVDQLKNSDQVMMVKVWAAQGLTNVAQGGHAAVDSGKANLAAKALSEFLQAEPDASWWMQRLALEALGSLRLATDLQGQGQSEMASTALRFLADAKARLEVRAMAAWALGMMRVPAQVKYNYALVAYHMGQLAAALGEKVDSSFSESPDLAMRMTGMLLYRVLVGLRGDDSVRESGLLHAPNLGAAQKQVSEIEARVQAITVAAHTLTSAATPKKDLPQKHKDLAAKVAALKDYLSKNPPAERSLIPGGPEFPGSAQQVAEK